MTLDEKQTHIHKRLAEYKQTQSQSKQAYCLSGPPGSGKTLMLFATLANLGYEKQKPIQCLYLAPSLALLAFVRETWEETIRHQSHIATIESEDKKNEITVDFCLYSDLVSPKNMRVINKTEVVKIIKTIQHKTEANLTAEQIYREFKKLSFIEENGKITVMHEKYFALGKKKTDIEEKQKLLILNWFERYQQTLSNQQWRDIFFEPPLDLKKNYDAVIVDEGQDFSLAQLGFLERLAQDRFIVSIDDHQNLTTIDSVSELLKLYLHPLALEILTLENHHRCPAPVVHSANGILEQMNRIATGLPASHCYEKLPLKVETEEKSAIYFMPRFDENQLRSILQEQNLANVVVIIRDESQRSEAKEKFAHIPCLIYTAEQAKGLEYVLVIAYCPLPEKIVNELVDLDQKNNMSGKNYTGRAKDSSQTRKHSHLILALRQLLVSVTRSTQKVVVIQTNKTTEKQPRHADFLKKMLGHTVIDLSITAEKKEPIKDNSCADFSKGLSEQINKMHVLFKEKRYQEVVNIFEQLIGPHQSTLPKKQYKEALELYEKAQNKVQKRPTEILSLSTQSQINISSIEKNKKKKRKNKSKNTTATQQLSNNISAPTPVKQHYKSCDGKISQPIQLADKKPIRENLSEYLKASCKLSMLKFLISMEADVNCPSPQGEPPLHVACEHANTEAVHLLLEHKAEIHRCNHQGYFPLHIAVKRGNIEMTHLLLQKKATVDVLTMEPFKQCDLINPLQTHDICAAVTPCWVAASCGDIPIFNLLLSYGASINGLLEQTSSPLHAAITAKSVPITQKLVERQAICNFVDRSGKTPLHTAVMKTAGPEITQLLIDHSADLSLKTKGFKPIHLAFWIMKCATNQDAIDWDTFNILIKQDPNGPKEALSDWPLKLSRFPTIKNSMINFTDSTNKYLPPEAAKIVMATIEKEPLKNAINTGQIEEIDHILFGEHSTIDLFSPAELTDSLCSVLECPVSNEYKNSKKNIVARLIEKKADIHYSNESWPLEIAVSMGDPSCVELLLEHKAVVHPTEWHKRSSSLLHYTIDTEEVQAESSKLSIIKLLTAHQATVDGMESGCPPLHRAVSRGQSHIVRCLVEEKAPIDQLTKLGLSPLPNKPELPTEYSNISSQLTALSVALFNQHDAIIHFLLEHKASTNGVDGQTCSPLYSATIKNNQSVIKQLLGRGADPNQTNCFEHTALQAAATEGNFAVATLLLNAKADPVATTKEGWSAVFTAFFQLQKKSTCKYLTPGGISVKISHWLQPLYEAKQNTPHQDYWKTLELLLNALNPLDAKKALVNCPTPYSQYKLGILSSLYDEAKDRKCSQRLQEAIEEAITAFSSITMTK